MFQATVLQSVVDSLPAPQKAENKNKKGFYSFCTGLQNKGISLIESET